MTFRLRSRLRLFHIMCFFEEKRMHSKNQVTTIHLVDSFQLWKNPTRVPSQLEGKLCWQTEYGDPHFFHQPPLTSWIFSLSAPVSVGLENPTQIRPAQTINFLCWQSPKWVTTFPCVCLSYLFLCLMSPRKNLNLKVYIVQFHNAIEGWGSHNVHCWFLLAAILYIKGVRGGWNETPLVLRQEKASLFIFQQLFCLFSQS